MINLLMGIGSSLVIICRDDKGIEMLQQILLYDSCKTHINPTIRYHVWFMDSSRREQTDESLKLPPPCEDLGEIKRYLDSIRDPGNVSSGPNSVTSLFR